MTHLLLRHLWDLRTFQAHAGKSSQDWGVFDCDNVPSLCNGPCLSSFLMSNVRICSLRSATHWVYHVSAPWCWMKMAQGWTRRISSRRCLKTPSLWSWRRARSGRRIRYDTAWPFSHKPLGGTVDFKHNPKSCTVGSASWIQYLLPQWLSDVVREKTRKRQGNLMQKPRIFISH